MRYRMGDGGPLPTPLYVCVCVEGGRPLKIIKFIQSVRGVERGRVGGRGKRKTFLTNYRRPLDGTTLEVISAIKRSWTWQ